MHDHDTSPEVIVGSRVNPSALATARAGADIAIMAANIGIDRTGTEWANFVIPPEPEPLEAITVPPEPRSS